MASRGGLVDEGDSWAGGVSVLVEIAAAKQGNAEDVEIFGRNDVELGDGLGIGGIVLAAFDGELIAEGGRFVEREVAGGCNGCDAGDGLHFLQQGIPEGESFFVGGVAREVETELNREDIFGAEAGIDALEIDQAADSETGSDEEEKGHGDLRDDEGAAESAADKAKRGLAAAFL